MKNIFLVIVAVMLLFLSTSIHSQSSLKISTVDSIPNSLLGKFVDDYGIHYTVSDSVFIQGSSTKYHILEWNTTQQYIIAKNDSNNPTEAGLYTRIDYMLFTNMAPFLWGFCYTAYNAPTDVVAKAAVAADREHPMKGCNGFPFSRMKKVN